MQGKTICIISFSPISRDSRVLRQISSASRHFKSVVVLGNGHWLPSSPNIRFIRVDTGPMSFLDRIKWRVCLLLGFIIPKFWVLAYWYRPVHRLAYSALREGRYDLIIANDLHALPVAARTAEDSGSKLVFDAHEYSPDQRTDTWKGKVRSPYAAHLLRTFGSKIDALVTVSNGLAELYEELIGIKATVVLSAPARSRSIAKPVKGTSIQLVYHGNALRGRGLEILVDSMDLLDERYFLNLILVGDDLRFIASIKERAARVASERILFPESVAPSQVVPLLSEFDIGAFILPPRNLNYRYALPNKFFDFVAAGLAIAIGPSPEMAELVRKYDMGIVAPGFTSAEFASALNRLTTEDINRMKMNAIAASQELNAEIEQKKLLDVYAGLLSQS